MKFPLKIQANIDSYDGNISRNIELRTPLTFIVGPNGSGKTHLLKGLKNSFSNYDVKKVRFISAGRLGPLEQYRSKNDQYYYNIDDAKFGDKNEGKLRHEIESISGDLHTLYERPDILIKVRERLQKLFMRNIEISWDSGYLKVNFSKIGNSNSYYSSGREASGLLHLVGILSALYDDEVGVLLIDEPEVSLHPQLQAFLLKEITRVAGVPNNNDYKKLIIMATHSTEMIKISNNNDLLSFIFCNDLKEEPIQIPTDAGELKNKGLKNLVARLGQEHKLTLFSQKPLLVEGPSDVIICNALSDKLDLYLEAAGSQILPINGKEAMPDTVKLLRLMGKIPTVLVDADAFSDGLNLVNAYFNDPNIKTKANELVSNHGHQDILKMSSQIYANLCDLINKNWKDISDVAENHFYYTTYQNEEEIKRKRRAALCSLFVKDNLTSEWKNLKNSINSLFGVFQSCGLFILRKGMIESYYSEKNLSLEDKVNKSVLESEIILDSMNKNEVKSSYKDVIDCLEYASNSEKIDELRAIRDELLAWLTPIYARYKEGQTNLDTIATSNAIFNYRIDEENRLEVLMNSKVLDVNGFPIHLNKGDDFIKTVNKYLKLE